MPFQSDLRYNYLHDIALVSATNFSADWSQFPGLSFAWKFEHDMVHSIHSKHQWLHDNWHYSVYISVIYMIAIAYLQAWMKKRKKPFDLRMAQILWSASLAVFSIVGTIRCFPEFIYMIYYHGFESSYCNASYFMDVRLVFWYWIFVISKSAELGDTIFIVLRKKTLIPLHWIHHILTLCYSWFVFGDMPGTARWMVNMNLLIHSFMYTYYTLTAMRVRVPKIVNISITSLQISQMIFGLFINARGFQYKLTGVRCDMSLSVATTGLVLYGIFFVMFLEFFVKAYFKMSLVSTIMCRVLRDRRNSSDDSNNNHCLKQRYNIDDIANNNSNNNNNNNNDNNNDIDNNCHKLKST